jgi:hypothetical protein
MRRPVSRFNAAREIPLRLTFRRVDRLRSIHGLLLFLSHDSPSGFGG